MVSCRILWGNDDFKNDPYKVELNCVTVPMIQVTTGRRNGCTKECACEELFPVDRYCGRRESLLFVFSLIADLSHRFCLWIQKQVVSRNFTNISMILMLIVMACSLFSTLASINTPCSVKHMAKRHRDAALKVSHFAIPYFLPLFR